ncbi:uncharacterized protein [Spinacia oleracea]|uniref:Serine carboxypeptidase S28 family protein n=1 Tax=Spinacia oleracea TaxID=3562 RepID=A0ABM3RS94_SPIOL|nr:uncharacterized protein LOC130472090 [Spinacia oleracea]
MEPEKTLQHRFYGKSIPLGSIDKAMANLDVRACFTVAQALEDFSKIIVDVKKKFSTPNSSVIVIGGSYGGMLAIWFRLKYPHVTIGALASSAPLLDFGAIPPKDQYCSVVSQDFKDQSQKCYDTIRQSWAVIDSMSSKSSGLADLSRTFNTCSPLYSGEDLKLYLASAYYFAAQYNGRFGYWINILCDKIVNPPTDDIILAISRAAYVFAGSYCNNLVSPLEPSPGLDEASSIAWSWQSCKEIILPMGCGNNTMFEPNPYSLAKQLEDCEQMYGPYGANPHWKSAFYRGQDVKSALRKFGRNIIFSNGLIDPYSRVGILEDLSKTIAALTTKEGSHCLDLTSAQSNDPNWLKDQRRKEVDIFKSWIHASDSSNVNPDAMAHICLMAAPLHRRAKVVMIPTLSKKKRSIPPLLDHGVCFWGFASPSLDLCGYCMAMVNHCALQLE